MDMEAVWRPPMKRRQDGEPTSHGVACQEGRLPHNLGDEVVDLLPPRLELVRRRVGEVGVQDLRVWLGGVAVAQEVDGEDPVGLGERPDVLAPVVTDSGHRGGKGGG